MTQPLVASPSPLPVVTSPVASAESVEKADEPPPGGPAQHSLPFFSDSTTNLTQRSAAHAAAAAPSAPAMGMPTLPGPGLLGRPLPGNVALFRARKTVPQSSPRTKAFRKAYFPSVEDRDWNDWRWQSRHRIRTRPDFERFLDLLPEEIEAFEKGGAMLPAGVTPYYLSLVDRNDPADALRRTIVPRGEELRRFPGEADDPLGEDGHMVVPGLVHRYPDRVLFLVHDFCSTYCRYCTRSRVVGHGEITPKQERLQAAIDYIRATPTVRDVLLSGGDPLALADDKLDWVLTQLRAIPHVEFLRIGTKMPAVLPQRITPQFVRMLRRHHPLWMSIHFMHPEECSPESYRACARLADAGIPLGAQTVLAQGVNDDAEVMKKLMHHLLKMRVRPYYLYQGDPISGSGHFRTPVAKGLEIIAALRGHTTGYAVPTYVIDAPGGGGKIPLQPNYVVGRDGDDLLLRNYEGGVFRYPDPNGTFGDASPVPGLAQGGSGFGAVSNEAAAQATATI